MYVKVGLTQKLPLELLWVSELVPGGWELLFLQPLSCHRSFLGNASATEIWKRMNSWSWKCLLDSQRHGKSYRRMPPRELSITKSAGGVMAKIAWQGRRSWKELEMNASRSTIFQSSQRLMCWAVPLRQHLTDTIEILSEQHISSPLHSSSTAGNSYACSSGWAAVLVVTMILGPVSTNKV